MSAQDLPTPHIRFVFAALMLRAELMTWVEFETEMMKSFGPTFGRAIANHARTDRVANEPTHRHPGRGYRSSPRRV